jgi:hypothetical protein
MTSYGPVSKVLGRHSEPSRIDKIIINWHLNIPIKHMRFTAAGAAIHQQRGAADSAKAPSKTP